MTNDLQTLSDKTERRDKAWLATALTFTNMMSKDPNRKVGAVIVASDGRQCSFGYNGLVSGIKDDETNWSRPMKYELVRHAEINALLSCPFPIAGSTLYSTLMPCHRCLGDAINSGIKNIVYMEDDVPYSQNDLNIWYTYAKLLDNIRMYQMNNVREVSEQLWKC